MPERTHLTALPLEQLEVFFREMEERPFRARQVFAWIHGRQAAGFEDMTDLKLDLREKLADRATVACLRPVRIQDAGDGSARKYLQQLQDGQTVETVLIRHEDRTTVCVSSQVGCALGCTFCATARMGFKRNLTAGEIVEQVYTVMRDTGETVTNVVFMGMGEPMLNYDNVTAAAGLLSHPHGLAIGARHINISTAGHVPGIRRYTEDGHPWRLAVSLNDPVDDSRERIMPINRKWPMQELLAAAQEYTRTANKRITFEYVLIGGLTDQADKADTLGRILRGIRCKVNLIPYNPVDDSMSRPTGDAIDVFYQRLRKHVKMVTVRWSQGVDIQAACGQLATNN